MPENVIRPERKKEIIYTRIKATSEALDLKVKTAFEDIVQRIRDRHL